MSVDVGRALAREEDVNTVGSKNMTGLMWAVRNNNNSIVRLLLEQPTVDLNCTDKNKQTALHWAAFADNAEAVKLLLKNSRLTTANQKDNEGLTPVMLAMSSKNVNALRELGHWKVNLDTKNSWGDSLEQVARWEK